MRIDAGVGAKCELDAALDRSRPVGILLSSQRSLFLDDLRRQALLGAVLQDVDVSDDVRDEIRAVFFHEPHALFVHESTMLDRSDAGARRALDCLHAVRMRRDPAAPHRRFRHDRVQLLLRVLRRTRRLLF